VLSAPATAAATQQAFTIFFGSAADLTGATITLHAYTTSGAASDSLQLYAQDTNFNGDYGSFYHSLTTYSGAMQNISYVVGATSGYNPALTGSLSVVLIAGGASTMSFTIDSITITGAAGTAPGPFTFDASVSPMIVNNYNPSTIPSSTITWIP